MFKNMRQGWEAARGEVLREELEDCLRRLGVASEDVQSRCGTAITIGYLQINKNYGPLSNISNDGKRAIAKNIRNIAKKEFAFDMGRGHGLFLLSAYLEAQTLPGEDAAFVTLFTQRMLAEALGMLTEAPMDDNLEVDRGVDNVVQDGTPPVLSERPRDRLTAIVREYGVRIADEGDDIQLAAAVAAHVTRTVIGRCAWEPKGPSEEQKFAATVFSVVAADHCSRLAGAPFELAHAITTLELFKGLDPSATGSLIREATEEYTHMLANPIDRQVIQSIGNNIAKWIDDRDEIALHKLSRLLNVLAEAPIRPRSIDRGEIKPPADAGSKPPATLEQPSLHSQPPAQQRKLTPARAVFAVLTITGCLLAAVSYSLERSALEQAVDVAEEYVRISPGDGGSAEISVTPVGANRYHVTGVALWGEYRRETHPVHMGSLDFTAERKGDSLEYSEPIDVGWSHRVVLRFAGDMLHVTEENWVGVHGHNVTFEGAYRRRAASP